MALDAEQLQRAMPGLPAGKAREYASLLASAMVAGQITTQARAHAFLAQLGHESVSLRFMEEIASGAAYEGRRDLGNVRPGDGRRYKGRGPIQLTGRSNYRTAGQALGLPLEANPTLAARPSVGFRIAVWYWATRGLNALADRGAFDEITRRINGGQNGRADRRARWSRIRALGAAVLPAAPDPLTARERRLVGELERIRRDHGKVWNAAEKARAEQIKEWIVRQRERIRAAAGRSGWDTASRRARYHALAAAYRG